MRKGLLILTLATAIADAGLSPANSTIHSVPIPGIVGIYHGAFPGAGGLSDTISFGGAFQSIQSVTLRWSGFIGHGFSYEHRQYPNGQLLPHGGIFEVRLDQLLPYGLVEKVCLLSQRMPGWLCSSVLCKNMHVQADQNLSNPSEY